jgi:amino acid adenylation domain-containing protein
MPVKIPRDAVDRRVHDLFADQSRRTPDALAVVCGDARLTYSELDRRSDSLAAHLQSLGARPEVLVGIYLERSIEMLVALLAVMKSGGAYLPLDPDFPSERIAHMVADAASPLIITQASLRETLPPTSARLVVIEECDISEEGKPDTSPERAATPSSSAYVIYTSGSTGTPKGVVIEHRSVVNFLLSMAEEPGLGPRDALLAVTTLSFDIAVLELLLPLVVGARTVLASRDEATDGDLLQRLLAESGATVMQATPSSWRLLVEAGWGGGPDFKILCGGEALPVDLARELQERAGSVWNMYGPTETTVWSTCYRLPSADAPVLIGRPIANTQVYVLNRSLQPVPVGVPGDLWIGGAGVARGYLGRDELTAERFLPDPFQDADDSRMYKTGDVGRYLRDGNLEYRSRVDNQVKVRGFRIELGEIEAAVSTHPAVRQAVAKVLHPGSGDARIAAYLVPIDGGEFPSPSELRDHLRQTLPQYMIPQYFVRVDELPLTPNGKVDRAQLPPPSDDPGLLAETFVEPRSPAERAVAEAWGEVLEMPRVSVDANFFDLGGHSVLAVRAVARLRKELGVAVSLRQLFQAPSVEALAREIETLPGGPGASADEREDVVF